jgi:hypothetical protein
VADVIGKGDAGPVVVAGEPLAEELQEFGELQRVAEVQVLMAAGLLRAGGRVRGCVAAAQDLLVEYLLDHATAHRICLSRFCRPAGRFPGQDGQPIVSRNPSIAVTTWARTVIESVS